jgi:hypothetical protein
MSRETPPIELVLSRLFSRYFGAGAPNTDVYGNEIKVYPGMESREPIEMIACQLIEINASLSSIVESLSTIANKE